MSRRVLVTGGTGFLGLPLTKLLVERGDDVHVISRSGAPIDGSTPHGVDLLDTETTLDLVMTLEPTCLLHLAWVTSHGTYWADESNHAWQRATVALFDAFAEAGGRNIVAAGSCAEYDWTIPGPYGEDSPVEPATLYGQCKAATHQEAREHLRDTDVTLCWARLFHLYGIGEHPDRLVPALLREAQAGTTPTPRHPDNVIDLLHIDDAARAISILSDTAMNTPVNVAGGVARSLHEIAGEIAAQHALAPAARGDDATSESVITADVTRLHDHIGFSPEIDLSTGLARCASAVAHPA